MTTLKMSWPANCKVITQQYGNKSARYVSGYHTGIDIGCITGSPIFAAHDGIVEFSGWNGVYGNEVRLRYNGSLITSYHHMSRTAVYKGDQVSAGKVLGYIGSTGQSTGPHLHFEVRENGKAVNPNQYLGGGGVVPIGNNPVVPDAIESPLDAFSAIADWLSDTKNWFRIGLILAGFVLGLIAVVGMAKAQALGKIAGTAVKTGTSKMTGGKSSGSGTS